MSDEERRAPNPDEALPGGGAAEADPRPEAAPWSTPAAEVNEPTTPADAHTSAPLPEPAAQPAPQPLIRRLPELLRRVLGLGITPAEHTPANPWLAPTTRHTRPAEPEPTVAAAPEPVPPQFTSSDAVLPDFARPPILLPDVPLPEINVPPVSPLVATTLEPASPEIAVTPVTAIKIALTAITGPDSSPTELATADVADPEPQPTALPERALLDIPDAPATIDPGVGDPDPEPAVPEGVDVAPPPATPVSPLTAIAEALPDPDPEPEIPKEQADEVRQVELITRGGLFSRFAWPSQERYWNGYLGVLMALATLGFLMFTLVEPSPRWVLLLTAGAAVIGLDGVLRATWRAAFAGGEDTTSYLFLPALYVFAAPMLIEHNVTGRAVILWALAAGGGFAALAVGELLSVRTGSRLYSYARMVTTGAAYFAAFALLALTYILDIGLTQSLLATWLIATMLAIEVVREGAVDPVETALFAAIAGLVVAQARWLLFFVPADGYLAGLALVLVFYLVAGVLHSYVLRQLTAMTAAEYALITTIGLVLVGAALVAGLA